jgi:uncharacterized membrane protein
MVEIEVPINEFKYALYHGKIPGLSITSRLFLLAICICDLIALLLVSLLNKLFSKHDRLMYDLQT